MPGLAHLVETQQERVLQMWTDRLRAELAPHGTSGPELRDHIPVLLHELAVSLRSGRITAARSAVAHGGQRYRIGFDIDMVVREYGLLREVLFDLVESGGDAVNMSEVRHLTRFLTAAIAEGVAEHGRRSAAVEAAALYELHAAERAQTEMLMAAPVAIAIVEGPHHLFTLANPSYRALVDGREIVGQTVATVLREPAASAFAAFLDRVHATGEACFGVELPVTLAHHAPGDCLYLNFAYTPKRNIAGEVDGVLVTGWDVSALVKARHRVEVLAASADASEQQLRSVTDALPMLISAFDVTQTYRMVNRAYEEWFGVAGRSVIGRPIRELIGETAYARLRPAIERGLAGEHFTIEQAAIPYRDGGTRDVRITYAPQRTASGDVTGVVALVEDVTQRRTLTLERETLARQRTEVLESMSDAFFSLDRDGRVALVNRNYETLTGTSRQDCVGQPLWTLLQDRAGPESFYGTELARCMVERVSVRFVDHPMTDGQWTEVRAFPTDDGGMSVFLRDVSIESTNEALAHKRAAFERQLIGIVSHDLRNPLNVVLLGSKLLRSYDDLSERSLKQVTRIENAAERSARLVRDLLDFTQARLGVGIQINPEAADLHAIVRAMVDELGGGTLARPILAAYRGDGSGRWDSDRLTQVVQNLLSNALKYSPTGSAIDITSDGTSADAVCLVVHNGGAPIPASKLPVLFEPYERAAADPDPASRSVGLGLYIVKHIVEAHGGTVSVSSTPADGTRFVVTLPRMSVR